MMYAPQKMNIRALDNNPLTQLVSIEQVMQATCIERERLKELEKEGKFPKRIMVTPHRPMWVQTEVQEWITKKIRARK